jgi:hypothetical protein
MTGTETKQEPQLKNFLTSSQNHSEGQEKFETDINID